ncbi:MAG: hypothetical protein Q9168_005120 [Polycauliona sp. 1 TL-2023]
MAPASEIALGINELISAILSYLERKELKLARLVCKLWASLGGQQLIGALYISPREIDMVAFDGITQHSDLSKSVKHVVYDSAQFYNFDNAASYCAQLCVTQARGAYLHMGTANATIQSFKELIHPKEDIESAVDNELDPLKPPRTLARFRSHICHESFIDGFLRYSQHFQERGNILKSSWFARVVKGLKSIGPIYSVVMANTWNNVYQHGEINAVYEEELLYPGKEFCHGDYRRLRSCTVPINRDDRDFDRLVNSGRIACDGRRLIGSPSARAYPPTGLPPVGSKTLRKWPECECVITPGAAGLLETGMSDGSWELGKLVDAVHEAGQMPLRFDFTRHIEHFTGIPASMFKVGGSLDTGAFHGLAHNLRILHLDIISFSSRDELKEELKVLVQFLQQAKKLEDVALNLPHIVPPRCQNYSLNQLFEPIEEWIRPNLKRLVLEFLTTTYDDLSRLLFFNLPNLERLYLKQITLKDGSWENIVEGLRQIVPLISCIFDGPFWHPSLVHHSIYYSFNNTAQTAGEINEFHKANGRYITEGGTHPQSETYTPSCGLLKDIEKTLSYIRGTDTNDDQALSQHLNKINVSFPASYGGIMKDESKPEVVFTSFNTHAPPDVLPNTRIVAVLGLTPEEAVTPESMWFISDFFAFWNLMHGLTTIQHWFHALDIQSLVNTNKVYLHGNPYNTRKVVLDQAILNQACAGPSPIQRSDPTLLAKHFREAIKTECTAAAAAQENVLLMMFGHGHEKTQGIYLGGRGSNHIFKPATLQRQMKGLNVNLTLLTTQCFGGGWSCSPNLNITTMTAAGKGQPSKAWRYSGSCGRACGSMFATAIINKLTKRPQTNEPLIPDDDSESLQDPPDWTSAQHTSYADFSKAVYESLLCDIDRRGLEHEITFSAQDDAWAMCWGNRTGIPLTVFNSRWAQLEDYPADKTLHPGDPYNRDPTVSEELRREYLQLWASEKERLKASPTFVMPSAPIEPTGSVLGKRKMSGRYGGNVDSLISTVKTIGADYLKTDPGGEDTANSGGLHHYIGRIIRDEEKDQAIIEKQLRIIQFRMEQLAAADHYLEVMDITPPLELSCSDFDTRTVHKDVPDRKFQWILDQIHAGNLLFPGPMEQQGHELIKGPRYLIIAFHLAKTTDNEITQKLDDLKEVLETELEMQQCLLKRDPEVTSKRQKLFNAFGWGIMSPRKRRSLAV